MSEASLHSQEEITNPLEKWYKLAIQSLHKTDMLNQKEQSPKNVAKTKNMVTLTINEIHLLRSHN